MMFIIKAGDINIVEFIRSTLIYSVAFDWEYDFYLNRQF